MEASLIERAKHGDHEAFAALLGLHAVALRRFIRRRTAQDADRDDCLQATALKVWQNLSAFDHQCTFLPWLLTLAAHAVTDHHRARHDPPG